MSKKLAIVGTLIVLVILTVSLCSASASSAAPRHKALRYRVIGHMKNYDVVRGHHRVLRVGHHRSYVDLNGVRRYRVVKRNHRFVVLRRVASLSATASTPTVAADTAYYVATTGDDRGNGSAASPWRTIQKAANTVPGGASVHVAAGIYNERVTIPAACSGAAGATTQFIADGAVIVAQGFVVNSDYVYLHGFEVTPGSGSITDSERSGQVTINGNHNTLDGFNIHDIARASGILIGVDKTYNTITNFTIDTVKHYGIVSGAWNDGPNHTTVSNGYIARWGSNCAIEACGDYWTIDNCTIRGINAGWFNDDNGDGIWTNYNSNSIIRNCTIYDIWPYGGYANGHSDCIQFWVACDNLLIDGCKLGTAKPGGPDNSPGPTSCVMLGTVSAGSHCHVTMQNSLFLTGKDANGHSHPTSSAIGAGATLEVYLYNNTFYGDWVGLNACTTLVMQNNVFLNHNWNPTSKPATSDYNVFLWGMGRSANDVLTAEGAHSIGKTYETRASATDLFVNPDVTETTYWGLNADFSLKAGSKVVAEGNLR